MSDPESSDRDPPPRETPAEGSGPPGPVRVLLILAFVAVCGLGVARVDEHVRGLEDWVADLRRVAVEEHPAWQPATAAASLAVDLAAPARVSLRSTGLPDLLADHVARDPRVAEVLGVRRRHPDALEVRVRLRRPVARVVVGAGRLPVDETGVRVPGDFPALDLPLVVGSTGAAPPPGGRFTADVRAGLGAILAVPADLCAELGLTVVDVSSADRPTDGGIRLRRPAAGDRAAVVVDWGRGPTDPDAALDPAPHEKVDRLRLARQRFPGLVGLARVDLRWDDLVVLPGPRAGP